MASAAEVSLGATKAAGLLAQESGRLTLHAASGLMRRVQPNYVPPEIAARQAALKKFEGRFGVVDLIDGELSDEELEVRTHLMADALIEEGLADEETFVELRDILPEDVQTDPIVNERRKKVADWLQTALEEEHTVMAMVTNPHPITPSATARPESPLDVRETWAAIAPEVDLLWHQMYGYRREGRGFEPAMIAISQPRYERALFGGQVTLDGSQQDGFLALDRVGRVPEENRLELKGK